jgi:hypothetical protein
MCISHLGKHVIRVSIIGIVPRIVAGIGTRQDDRQPVHHAGYHHNLPGDRPAIVRQHAFQTDRRAKANRKPTGRSPVERSIRPNLDGADSRLCRAVENRGQDFLKAARWQQAILGLIGNKLIEAALLCPRLSQ